jgi:hypothetical protein
MKARFILVALSLMTACKREPTEIHTRLAAADRTEANAPVLLHGRPIGSVAAVEERAGQRSARLVIRPDAPALPVGTVVTEVSPSGIELDASLVGSGAPQIERGHWLPRRTPSPAEAFRIDTQRLAERIPGVGGLGLERSTVLVGAALALVVLFLLRGALVAAFIAGGAAWLLHPFLLPWVTRQMVKARQAQTAVEGVGSTFAEQSVAAGVNEKLTEILNQAPGPVPLSFGLTFLVFYLVLRALQAASRASR